MSSWPALDVERLLERLTTRGVDFVIVGGIAAVLLGSARITRDLDVCYATDEGNLEALGEVLLELDARLRGVDEVVPFVPDWRTLRRVELLTLNTDAGPLDLISRPPGAPGYEALRRNARRFDVGGFSVLVASIDDMLAMKRSAGRPQDLADIEELEAIRRLS
jgi:predicted nucleotidyltransferase